MGRFFTRERFGRPQILAGLLLLVFLGQCAWLVHRSAGLTPSEEFTDYKDGFHIENGQKAKMRRREQDDKLDPDGDPLGERVAQ